MLKIYKVLPLFLQNLILTIKNNHLYYIKYGSIPFFRPFKGIVKKLPVEELLSEEDSVLDSINKAIENAVENVPYFQKKKELYKKLEKAEELKKLPVLLKKDIKENNNEFLSKDITSRNSYQFKTSGTTGTPIYGFIKLKDLKKRQLTVLASMKNFGINYSLKVGRFLGAEIADSKNVYRKDYINNHYFFSIYSLSESNVLKYYKSIEKNKIEVLEGYPSTIYSLVKLLRISNLTLTSVKSVITTAEKLLDHQREEIESYFNCKIFDFYGSSEGSAYIYTNNENSYSVATKLGIIELVNEDYSELKDFKKPGRMLVTSFTSTFMPLIRYDIGDYCLLSNENNSEFLPKIIDTIIGRDDDIFITEEGVYFTRFSLCVKYLPKQVIESKLLLKNRMKNVKVIYTSDSGVLENENFTDFENKFISMLGKGYQFVYEYVKEFDKSRRGKLKVVTVEK